MRAVSFTLGEEKKCDFHCDDCARMETATLPNVPQEDDKRQ